jgi:hypothetical protein
MGERVRQLQKSLLQEVGKVVAQHGFDPKPVDQSFRRRLPDGSAVVHVGFVPHGDVDVDVTGDVAVRFDAVEDLLNEDRALSNTEKKRTATLGAEFGNLAEGRQRRWKLKEAADVAPVATAIGEAVRTIAVPYIQKYGDMEAALEALSGNDAAAWLHSPFHDARAKRSVALASILGPPSRMEETAARARAFLVSRSDPGLAEFDRFVEKLRRGARAQA